MKPLALVLAAIAIIAFATSRPPLQSSGTTPGANQGAPSVVTSARIRQMAAEDLVNGQPSFSGPLGGKRQGAETAGVVPTQLSDKGGVWGTPPPTDALAAVTQSGLASWMPERYGSRYLALPIGRGHRVELCGPGGCVTLTSTDAGPDLAMQRAGRVADIGVRTWERVCAVGRKYGLCEVSWTVVP